MLLSQPNTRNIGVLSHEGKVLIVATVSENNATKFYYSVKQDGFEDSALQNPYGTGWEEFKPIPFPNDPIGDPSVEEEEQQDLTDRDGQRLLRSIYDSATMGADAPAQLVSHDGHVYLFRQSTRDTLLVDRFVLDGMTNTLTPKLEVRFKRSRQRYKPLKAMKINSSGQLESEDALDFRDMNDEPFFAPTIELLLRAEPYRNQAMNGWFDVVINPTNEQDNYRWHIFTCDDANHLNLYSLRADSEYIFDVKDYWSRTVDEITDKVSYESIPGLIHRKIALHDSSGDPLTISNGLAAVKYDVQREQETESGPQIMRDESKIMLAVPTESGIAVLAFAIAADGTLAQITAAPNLTPLRQQEREILLPLDLLDEIRAVGDQSPGQEGTIIGMHRSNETDTAGRVQVQVAKADQAVQNLNAGDIVKLGKTRNYNGLYSVTASDENTFTVSAGADTDKLGDWVKVEPEESGLVFDGQVLGYTIQGGKLKMTAVNHGLTTGDKVQIIGSISYDGEFPVLAHDEHSFTIQRLWDESEAVNVRIESRKRRGLIFDGKNDWIEIPLSKELKLTDSFTLEAWVKLDSIKNEPVFVIAQEQTGASTTRKQLQFAVDSGSFGFLSASAKIYSNTVQTSEWVHLACVCHTKTVEVFRNGVSEGKGSPAEDLSLKANLLSIGALMSGSPNAGKREPTALLDGQLAEVRLWTTARTADEINANMFLQLTGRETGLAGYWRLGGVALEEDGTQRVYDFSVNANHGIVHGNPHAGSIALARNLRDNKTPAIKFVNDELVAVREGATYLESFEFHTTPPIADPKNAENDQPLFTPSLWGRLSRGAEDKTGITPLQKDFEFKTLGDGWWSASCRFIIPEGVRLMRGFEIGEVCGSWQTLEVRRPRLTLVSDTVTQSDANEYATLTALAGIERPAESLRQLDQLERAEVLNLNLKDELQRKLDDSTAKNLSEKLRGAEADKRAAESQYQQTKAEYDQALPTLRGEWSNADWNEEYFHRGGYVDARPVVAPAGKVVKGVRLLAHLEYERKEGSRGDLLSLEISVGYPNSASSEFTTILNPGAPADTEKIECPEDIDVTPVRIPDGRIVTGVRFINKNNRLALQVKSALEDGSDEKWHEDNSPPPMSFRSEIKGANPDVDTNLVRSDNPNQPINGIWLYQKNNRIAPKLGWYQLTDIKNWNDKLARAEQSQKEAGDRYNELFASSNADETQRQAWKKQIDDLQTTLDRLRQQLNSASITYMQQAAQAIATPQSMPTLANVQDPRGLAVQGALLTFAQPATRLHAMESVTGRVTLTYQENDGALRQTHYDTTYDADGTAEEWLSEPYRVAVEFGETVEDYFLPTFDAQGFGEQVTIEFWARGAYQDLSNATFLTATDKDNKIVLQIMLPNANEEVVWEAGNAKADTLDRIAHAVGKQLYRDQWTHWAFVKDAHRGEMRVYVNGALWHKNDSVGRNAVSLKQSLAGISKIILGGKSHRNLADRWKGRIAELRIWNVALNDREIEANSMLTLSGNEPGLVAYYPFNEAQGDTARDLSGKAQPLDIRSNAFVQRWVPCTAPIGQLYPSPISLLNETKTAPPANPDQVAALAHPDQTGVSAPNLLTVEYSRVRVDAEKRKAAMMLRAVALASDDGVRLWDEQRIEELELRWIGNAQINPTLVGYIEGAPPVPSENLTEEQDYNSATSVELVQSSDVEYSWTREQEMRADVQVSALVGLKSGTSIGLGIQTSAEEVKSGVGADIGFVYGWQNASTVGASHTEMTSERLELRGSQEEEAHFAHLGRRFVPKDIGYAVVVSGLADVFVTKLKRSGRMVSYQMLPVQGIPLDVNTITFLLNPAYTMAGSLDGLTGSRATSERFFPNVPKLRSQYGSLYSASYFRLERAYSLKAQIEKADEQRQAYFHQFDQQLITDALLENQVEDTEYDSAAVGVDVPQSASADLADTNKQITQTQKELDELGTGSQSADARKQKQSELDELKKKRDELEQRQKNEQAERTKKGEARQDDINKKYSDLSTRAHASDSFATWQKKMEDLQIRAGKRNIVNTYVWDGDGGLHAEEQQFASTVEHSIGGSYDFSAGLGVQASIAISKALVELNVQAQYGITQTMSKSERGGKALELHVDLSGVESRGITDFRDNPMLPGEKVDRYRFMSFYLENNVNHWHDFFNYVVNPEWLASNDEEARALRQTQNALPNKVWRVLHRVTYVERPALMGFGRTLAKTHRAADDIRELRQQVDDLNNTMVQMQNEINAKLDQLLTKKA